MAVTDEAVRWRELGRAIDALISTDFTARGVSHRLYDAAFQDLGYPLSMAAAFRLRDSIEPGDVVLICTGWPSRSWLMRGLTETDGPAGAAYLARVLEQCLGAIPFLVVEESLTGFAESALRAAGLIVAEPQIALKSKDLPHTASVGSVVDFTTDWADADQRAGELVDELGPSAVVCVELPGANDAGEYHNVTAREVPTELVIKADAIVRLANSRSITTVGVGDGGNELGFGRIQDTVKEVLANGAEVAPSTPVGSLVVGSISNWAAVGLAASIAAITGIPEVLRTVDLMRITDRLSEMGAIDGLTSYVDSKNDGTPPATNHAFVEMLATAVEMHLGGWNKG